MCISESCAPSFSPCEMTDWIRVKGILVEGYRVASGPSKDYPYGALDRQRPIFASRGLDLGGYFNGSLNIDISPCQFKLIHPEFTFHHVEWTGAHQSRPAERGRDFGRWI